MLPGFPVPRWTVPGASRLQHADTRRTSWADLGIVKSSGWQETSPGVTDLRSKCAGGLLASIHLHNCARGRQSVPCLPGWGCFAAASHRPHASPSPSCTCTAGPAQAGEVPAGQGDVGGAAESTAAGSVSALGKQWPVPVFKNSTRAAGSASCLLSGVWSGVGPLGGLGVAFLIPITVLKNNGKVVESSWGCLLFEGSHRFQT